MISGTSAPVWSYGSLCTANILWGVPHITVYYHISAVILQFHAHKFTPHQIIPQVIHSVFTRWCCSKSHQGNDGLVKAGLHCSRVWSKRPYCTWMRGALPNEIARYEWPPAVLHGHTFAEGWTVPLPHPPAACLLALSWEAARLTATARNAAEQRICWDDILQMRFLSLWRLVSCDPPCWPLPWQLPTMAAPGRAFWSRLGADRHLARGWRSSSGYPRKKMSLTQRGNWTAGVGSRVRESRRREFPRSRVRGWMWSGLKWAISDLPPLRSLSVIVLLSGLGPSIVDAACWRNCLRLRRAPTTWSPSADAKRNRRHGGICPRWWKALSGQPLWVMPIQHCFLWQKCLIRWSC